MPEPEPGLLEPEPEPEPLPDPLPVPGLICCCPPVPAFAEPVLFCTLHESISAFIDTSSAASCASLVLRLFFCASSWARSSSLFLRKASSSLCLDAASSAACCALAAWLSAWPLSWVISSSMAVRRSLRFIDVLRLVAAASAAFASLRVTAASDCILLTKSSVVVALVTTSIRVEASEPWKLSRAS